MRTKVLSPFNFKSMVVVVYRKSKTAKKKFMTVFMNEEEPSKLLNGHARKPLIPHEYVLDEVGIGERFITLYKSKHDIKNHQIIK